MTTFQQRVDQFHREAPIRAARRANESPLRRFAGKLVGLAVLLTIMLLGLLVVAFVVYAVAHSWRLVFAAAVILTFLAAIAKVTR